MSRVGENFSSGCLHWAVLLVLVSIGRAGARKTRRVITRRAVGWRPPSGPPSGVGRMLGTSVPDGLVTGAAPRPMDAQTPSAQGCQAGQGLARWRQRYLLGNGPHKRTACPRDGHAHLGGMLSCGAQLSGA